jgi:pimeloyl-ACP methyl ester carboxylesterase
VKRSTYIIAIVILLQSAASMQAQQAKTSSGTYTTYIADNPFGIENYTLTTNADGSTQSQSDGNFGPTKFKTTTRAEKNRPKIFTVTADGGGFQADFTGEVVKITIPGQPVKEVKAQPTVLLENGVWHHFLYLFAQYDPARSGPQSFNAFVPSQGVPFDLTLEHLDSPIFKIGGQPVTTEHFRAGTNLGLVFEIWTDSSHVPLFIQVPAQQLKMVRKGSEPLAELIAQAQAKPVTSANDPYSTEEVSFQNGEQKLVGTLTIPKKGAPPFPGVVIISGAGPQDRDGSAVANIYRLIAEHLSANGVAVLRVDDRGVGKSIPQTGQAYRDFVNDSKAAFEFLLKRPEMDKKKIGFAGHSEGALTALVIAAEDPRVAAIMLLAGGSRSLDRIIFEQALNRQALDSPVNPSDKTRYSQFLAQMDQVFNEVRSKPKPADPANDPLAYFRQHLEIDPLAVARRVRVPTLILNGERDDNVLPYHALELAQAMADSGNKQVLVRIFPNLTHVFTPSQRDKSVTGAQAAEVSAEFLELLQSWAASVLVRGKAGGVAPEK